MLPHEKQAQAELVERNLTLLGKASEDDLDELLHDLLVRTHPSKLAQDQ